VPDYVPTFELEYQLGPEVYGIGWLTQGQLDKMTSEREKEHALKTNAENMLYIYGDLGYSILPIHGLSAENQMYTARYIRKLTGNEYMLTVHGDATFSVPDGNQMYDFAYRMVDEPESLLEEARKNAERQIERNHRMVDAGIDSFILCSDYCYNNGPFLSPANFGVFIQPYLARIIENIRKDGAFAIKHTDGNIMPILDQLVECRPHALHSLDPMAGVDIKEVKRLVGDKVALCGNVNCALMQTGTDEQVRESADYCLRWGKEGGGYIFCTSNVPFRGMPPERYRLILDIWKEKRAYHE
jgi:uroporphyrinogen decarboxylase